MSSISSDLYEEILKLNKIQIVSYKSFRVKLSSEMLVFREILCVHTKWMIPIWSSCSDLKYDD